MSINGDKNIKTDSLKRWAQSLNVDELNVIDIGGRSVLADEEIKKILRAQLHAFYDCINGMGEKDDWRNLQGLLSPLFYNAFVRIDNSSIRIGDFYECLIEPANIKTYKKIIRGYNDYLEIGAVHLYDLNNNVIASIGEKSDLIWSVFYNYFIKDDNGSIEHVFSNHNKYLSIQLFNVEPLSVKELKSRINEIFLFLSMKYDMDFKVFEVNSVMTSVGNAPIIRDEYNPVGFEEVPMYYLSNANSTNDARFKFLSYYQVIEYFFVRAQNYYFLNQLKNINTSAINHIELRKILIDYKKMSSERESLKLVIDQSIDISDFTEFIKSNSEYYNAYCNSEDYKIDITKSRKKIISCIADRVYTYRCSIAHSKGDVEEYIAIPFISNEKIALEIPLVKYLSYKVIRKYSKDN